RPSAVTLGSRKESSLTDADATGDGKIRGCSDNANIVSAALFVFNGFTGIGVGRNRSGHGKLPREFFNLRKRDLLPLARFYPFVMRINEPITATHIKHVGANERNAANKCAVQSFDRRAHQRDRDNADDNAERSKD